MLTELKEQFGCSRNCAPQPVLEKRGKFSVIITVEIGI